MISDTDSESTIFAKIDIMRIEKEYDVSRQTHFISFGEVEEMIEEDADEEIVVFEAANAIVEFFSGWF